ncbi:hypothetical protein SLS54_000810 [Diplodia seriata]
MSDLTAQPKGKPQRLKLITSYGPVYREIKSTEARDARPGEIPVIDVSAIFGDDLEPKRKLAREIASVAEDTGFFYIKNHGIPATAIEAALLSSASFFQQPEELKRQVHTSQSRFLNGWIDPKSPRPSDEESSADMCEHFSLKYDPEYDPTVTDLESIPYDFRRCFKGEEWYWERTSHIPEFKKNLVGYWQAGLSLARRLTGIFALALDVSEDYFAEKTLYPDASMTLNHCRTIQHSEGSPGSTDARSAVSEPSSAAETLQRTGPDTLNVGTHTDLQLFSILWQDHQGGLQVLTSQGEWINVKPVEGALGVNIADFLMRITNDRWKSTVHRVKHDDSADRYSMSFFFDEQNPAKYDPISCEELVRQRFQVATDRA